jgi:hypothetical protein
MDAKRWPAFLIVEVADCSHRKAGGGRWKWVIGYQADVADCLRRKVE